MNISFKPQLFAALMGTAAMVSPAFAQQTAGQTGDSCADLAQLTEENGDRLNPDWREQAVLVARSGAEADCTAYFDEASAALSEEGGSEAEVEARGRIVVTQPDPSVTVQQGQPEITVHQPQSRVTVNQGEPEITVRQAQPTITVEVPRPVITIDQPQPEIIVRMPEPQVGVETPEPEIEVRMPQPRVAVSQPEPQVQVDMAEGEGADDEADVQIEQGQATIRRVEPEGEAQVELQRGEPQIRYESAEPNVQFSEPQEPEVRYSQSGEPNIRIEREGEEQAAGTGAQDDPAAQAQQSAGTATQQPQAGAEASLMAGGDMAAQDPGQLQAYAVDDVLGTAVVGVRGDELGTVAQLVTDGQRNFAVVESNGAVDLGGEDLVIPLDLMSVEDGRLALRGMEQDDFAALQSGELATQTTPIGRDFQIDIATR